MHSGGCSSSCQKTTSEILKKITKVSRLFEWNKFSQFLFLQIVFPWKGNLNKFNLKTRLILSLWSSVHIFCFLFNDVFDNELNSNLKLLHVLESVSLYIKLYFLSPKKINMSWNLLLRNLYSWQRNLMSMTFLWLNLHHITKPTSYISFS